MERKCPGRKEPCGNLIPVQLGRGKPRKFCLTCSPPRGEPAETPEPVTWRRPVVAPPLPTLLPPPSPSAPQDGPVLASVRARLDEAERAGTPEAAVALRLAGLLDVGDFTASGAAALSRELRAALADALAGAPRAADGLDQLAQRRVAKAGA